MFHYGLELSLEILHLKSYHEPLINLICILKKLLWFQPRELIIAEEEWKQRGQLSSCIKFQVC